MTDRQRALWMINHYWTLRILRTNTNRLMWRHRAIGWADL
jgi:hypothetical protein